MVLFYLNRTGEMKSELTGLGLVYKIIFCAAT